ncbi:MAG: radical SAM protein [Candidatus Hydrogenedentota bacterium]
MINITRLYCNVKTERDWIRYGERIQNRKPVIVWNLTRKCNLRCIHCYSDSYNKKYKNELDTSSAKKVIKDLSDFKVPVILFSGGEPLLRKDIFELLCYAKSLNIRTVLSTNGTLITKELAKKIKDVSCDYVGISLDGIGKVNDYFRQTKGAFIKARDGFRNCLEMGLRVGLRLTLTKYNYKDLENVFDFIDKENIQRVCFYHLVYAGRGMNIKDLDLTPGETRMTMNKILSKTRDFVEKGKKIEVLTVDNHVDSVYIYLKLLKENKIRAKEVYKLLKQNGGGLYSSGVGIGCIDYMGEVHPDQFWMHYTLGNILERPFKEIWMDRKDPLMAGLKNRLILLKGKCSRCKYKEICGGSLRVRADIIYNDPWKPDPACYLTKDELSG